MSEAEQHFRQVLDQLPATARAAVETALADAMTPHGDAPRWDAALAQIPQPGHSQVDFRSPAVAVSAARVDREALETSLRAFMPWRKGPWDLCGVKIDSEWRSDLKWQRVAGSISPLQGRRVLDIGCGNGYYLYRMLGAGAQMVLGVDPTRLFLYQFLATRKLMPPCPAFMLPLRAETLPLRDLFDTVFSMGVLSHRRSPLDHLGELMNFLTPGGELILETLVVPGHVDTVLTPANRYARMANVWFLPSPDALVRWLERVGFEQPRILDVSPTTAVEQRSTSWMTFQSLSDFLDPDDGEQTFEGYPAPTRAIVQAHRPR
ncbi:MAG: tRNA 5-methoxyuridine(34)/uridine 5-oxyacetic acid(34) synthase CmoB [Proteobacteria bacterium]|nr:tRNA 5-methoxyuridine(34)/uridine 5-oxyacetic acid(34) synthase CmoB [Pseudomonadota bacterium]